MPLTYFTCTSCPLFVLATQRVQSTKQTQYNLQTAWRIHFFTFFKYFSHTCYVYPRAVGQVRFDSFEYQMKNDLQKLICLYLLECLIPLLMYNTIILYSIIRYNSSLKV